METSKYVFLDRDGVINVDKYGAFRISQLELILGVVEALQVLQALGFSFIVVTNQSAIGRGEASEAQVNEFNAALVKRLGDHGIRILDIFVCPHDPVFGLGEYKRDCSCRKPKTGMLFQAAEKYHIDLGEAFMVGDKKSDVVCGYNAGCRTILVETGILDDEALFPKAVPDFRVKSLFEASQILAGIAAFQAMIETKAAVGKFSNEICKSLLRKST